MRIAGRRGDHRPMLEERRAGRRSASPSSRMRPHGPVRLREIRFVNQIGVQQASGGRVIDVLRDGRGEDGVKVDRSKPQDTATPPEWNPLDRVVVRGYRAAQVLIRNVAGRRQPPGGVQKVY
jgi:hypothetical protein